MQQDLSEDALLNLDSDDQAKQQQIQKELAADREEQERDELPSVYDTLTKHFVSVDWPGWKAYRLEVSADVISYFM